MRIKKLCTAFVLGLGLALALLWLLDADLLPIVYAASFSVTKSTDSNDGICNADCSLREAIIAANSNGQADTITLLDATYTLTRTGTGENAAAVGDLDITDVLTITGLGPDRTIIDASGIISDRVFDIRPGAGTVVISGVAILNGHIVGNGSGIYNDNADLILINTIVSNNIATGTLPSGNGGGVYIESGSVALNGVQIVGNSANDNGGGVYIESGSAILRDGQIVSNTATWSGGGVYVGGGTAAFTQTGASIIAYNTTGWGGGVYVRFGSAMLSGGQIISNSARQDGGGAYVYLGGAILSMSGGQIANNTAKVGGGVCVYGNMTDATLNLSGGQIISNAAQSGGGVHVYYGNATLSMSGGQIISNTAIYGGGVYVSSGNAALSGGQISRNVADDGGGMYVGSGSAALNGVQIISNTANSGGGVYVYRSSATVLTDTVVSHNTGGGLTLLGGTVKVFSGTIEDNDFGFVVGGSDGTGSLLIRNTIISDNLTAGVSYAGTDSFTVTLGGTPGWANTFRNNGPGGGLNIAVTAANSHPPILAFYNDWGVSGLVNVEATLNHQFDNPGLARVDYYTLTLVAAPATQVADGVSPVNLTAALTGTLNQPVGEVIAFTASLGTLSALTDTIDVSHQACVTLTSTMTGTSLIFATTGADPIPVRPMTATVLFVGPDLVLSKSITPATTMPGQTATYVLTFSNIGTYTATGVVIVDVMPVSVTVQSVISSGVAITDTGTSPPYVWQVQDLAPGKSGVITITGAVSSALSADATFANTATITTANLDNDLSNNSSQVSLHVVIPRVQFSSSTYSVAEEGGPAIITVTLDAANPYADATVVYSTSNGTATAGEDYTAGSGQLVFTPGETTKTFEVAIMDDEVNEGEETVILTLTNPSNATIGGNNSAVLTIIDEFNIYLPLALRQSPEVASTAPCSERWFCMQQSQAAYPYMGSGAIGPFCTVSAPPPLVSVSPTTWPMSQPQLAQPFNRATMSFLRASRRHNRGKAFNANSTQTELATVEPVAGRRVDDRRGSAKLGRATRDVFRG